MNSVGNKRMNNLFKHRREWSRPTGGGWRKQRQRKDWFLFENVSTARGWRSRKGHCPSDHPPTNHPSTTPLVINNEPPPLIKWSDGITSHSQAGKFQLSVKVNLAPTCRFISTSELTSLDYSIPHTTWTRWGHGVRRLLPGKNDSIYS